MPGFEPGEGYRVPDEVIADQEDHAELVHEMQADSDYDEIRDESSALGRGKWLVILLTVLGVVGLVLLAYWVSLWLMKS
jgi:hypothetical protein